VAKKRKKPGNPQGLTVRERWLFTTAALIRHAEDELQRLLQSTKRDREDGIPKSAKVLRREEELHAAVEVYREAEAAIDRGPELPDAGAVVAAAAADRFVAAHLAPRGKGSKHTEAAARNAWNALTKAFAGGEA
jgi:hypothetical protein